jgi:hypothetical protein
MGEVTELLERARGSDAAAWDLLTMQRCTLGGATVRA